MRSNDLEFWTQVRARRDINDEAVKIGRRRRLAETIGALSGSDFRQRRPSDQVELRDAMPIFRRWAVRRAHRDKPYSTSLEYACGIYALELRGAKQKAFSRRMARFPIIPEEYDADVAAGKAAIPTPWDELGGAASWHEQEGRELGDGGDGFGVIVQGAVEIDREEWSGFEVDDHPMPTIIPADQELCGRILAKSPGRKRGRPRKHANDVAKQKHYREKLKLLEGSRPDDARESDRVECSVGTEAVDCGRVRKDVSTS